MDLINTEKLLMCMASKAFYREARPLQLNVGGGCWLHMHLPPPPPSLNPRQEEERAPCR